jgi:hypothetical protein
MLKSLSDVRHPRQNLPKYGTMPRILAWVTIDKNHVAMSLFGSLMIIIFIIIIFLVDKRL